MMLRAVLLLPLLQLSHAYRLTAVSEKGSAALMPTWHLGDLGRRIHSSTMVEVSGRGIRTMLWPFSSPYGEGHPCAPCEGALCCILPNATRVFPTNATANVGPALQPELGEVVRRGSCQQSGEGRTWEQGGAYALTACEVLASNNVLLYAPEEERIYFHRETFGPMAYTILLLCSIACLNAATLENANSTEVACAAILTLGPAATVLLHSVPLASAQDKGMFWLAVAMAAISYGRKKTRFLYSLSAFTVAMYRTPENPYSLLLAAVLATRLCLAALQTAPVPASQFLYCCADAWFLGMLVDIGLMPQIAHPPSAPFYLGAACVLVVAAACVLKRE